MDSSNEALPDEVPPQLADTPGPFLKYLALEPPRPPVATAVASPETSTGRRSEKKKKPSSKSSPKVSALTPKRKPAPEPKTWIPLCVRESKWDAYYYANDTKKFHLK